MFITGNDYCQAILISQDMDLSSIEKFFLIRIICSFGETGEVLATVDALGERLYLSEAVLKRTRNSLLKKEYLTDLPDPVNSGGRPRKCFKITTRCLELLQASVLDEELCNREWIEELLFNGVLSEICVPDQSGKIRKIKPVVRVLMGILLAHLSTVGLVSGLGHADLRKLTGNSLDCLKSQLNLLRDVHFIMNSRSGFTSKKTQKNVKGQYMLNLAWQGFGTAIKPGKIVYCPGKFQSASGDRLYKEDLLHRNAIRLMEECSEEADALELIRLRGGMDKNMMQYLLWVAMESASDLSQREVLKEFPTCLQGAIKAKVLAVFNEKTNEQQFEYINKFVISYTKILSEKIDMVLDCVLEDRVKGLRHMLIPVEYRLAKDAFILIVFDNSTSGTKIQRVVECGDDIKRMKLI